MVTGRRFETRIRVMSVKSPSYIQRPLAVVTCGALGLIRGYGLAKSRRTSCVIMLSRDGPPRTPLGTAKKMEGATSRRWKRLPDLSPESVYTLSFDKRRLRGSPSLVGRWIANPVRSAPGGSNPPPRAGSAGRTDVDPFLRRSGPVRGIPVEHGDVRLGLRSGHGAPDSQQRSVRHGRPRPLRGGAGPSRRPSNPVTDGRPPHNGSGNRGRYRGRLLFAASLGEGLRPAPHGARSQHVPKKGYANLDADDEP